ncbi:hypothetical protein D3C87_1490740 [compost metagenome]
MLPPGVGVDSFGSRICQRASRIADVGGEPALDMGRLTGGVVACAGRPTGRIHRHDCAVQRVIADAADVARGVGHRQRLTCGGIGRDRRAPGVGLCVTAHLLQDIAVQIIDPTRLDARRRGPDLSGLATQGVVVERRPMAARIGDAGHIARGIAFVSRGQAQTTRLRGDDRLPQTIGRQAAAAPNL